jgi:benzodiazapine receptor
MEDPEAIQVPMNTARLDYGMKAWLPMGIWIVVLQVIGAAIGVSSMPSVDGWYQDLHRSPMNPPEWAFGLAWTVLYVLIAAVGWRLWLKRDDAGMLTNLRLYVAQLMMNWTWSFIFFTAQLVWPAFIWLLVMVAIVGTMTVRLATTDRTSAWLLAPYLTWIAFASYLNGHIALNN